ncbi:ABC transporter ATP-binding protein [Gracilibacillus sp. HCP3S3_G5_1]|uniref:ABC transporter ATP-binding protein n=1 Tax=unclassified Gracilibacillus TaxID=2625209 RepID=UPI003F89ACC2
MEVTINERVSIVTIASMQGVVKRYGSDVVLDYIDLDIYEGEIVGLLGPNGAGKTTLIQTLTGMIPFERGSLELFGQSKNPFSHQNKERIGLVTQEITVFEELTVKENLQFFAGVYGLKGNEKKKRVEEALEFVGLGDKGGKFPTKFSGGMKRRLNIACALTHQPKLLIMDEPTVGIDPQSRNYILEAVKKLRENGTTILYTTHYMEEVQTIASRVVIMDQGQIIKEGTVEELIQTVQHEEKIKIDVTDPGKIPVNDLKDIAGVKNVMVSGSQITIISAFNAGNLDRIISVVKEHAGVLGIHADKPDLEDVFLTLTGKQLRDEGEGS